MYNKTVIRFGFCDILSVITLTSTLISHVLLQENKILQFNYGNPFHKLDQKI